jgi:DNA helicase II / ATP-dependent DNA helicase PcrA
VPGWKTGCFPHQRSLNDGAGLEEERRLCYVGATRAMKRAVPDLCRAAPPARHRQLRRASRFIREIPAELIEEVRPAITVSAAGTALHAGPGEPLAAWGCRPE